MWGDGTDDAGITEEYRRDVLSRVAGGVTAYVLNERLGLTAAGAEGRLYIGGLISHADDAAPGEMAGLFLPDPFAGEPGARMYATGLRARVTPDRRIEIVAGGGRRAGE
jgi:non-ribosomal peptide synthetase component F